MSDAVWLARSMPFVVIFVAVKQQFFRMMECVDTRLAMVEMRRWDPFGVAVGAFAGGPTLFGEFVVGAAGKGQVVDVSNTGLT